MTKCKKMYKTILNYHPINKQDDILNFAFDSLGLFIKENTMYKNDLLNKAYSYHRQSVTYNEAMEDNENSMLYNLFQSIEDLTNEVSVLKQEVTKLKEREVD